MTGLAPRSADRLLAELLRRELEKGNSPRPLPIPLVTFRHVMAINFFLVR